jgi:hypothetical protein
MSETVSKFHAWNQAKRKTVSSFLKELAELVELKKEETELLIHRPSI